MKVWTNALDYFSKKKSKKTTAIHIQTSQGRFTISEIEDGMLSINGAGPTNGNTHSLCFEVLPRSANDIYIGYRREIPPLGGE